MVPRVQHKRRPLYQHMKEVLRDRIQRGDLRPGDLVPSEKVLIDEFDVSSITARRCLNDLEQEGYVQRVQGKGTFVRDRDVLPTAGTIGIFYHELASITNNFISQVFKGVVDQLGDSQYHPELISWEPVRNSPKPSTALRELVRQRKIEGVTIVSPAPSEWFDEILADGVPVVSINLEYADPRVFGVMTNPLPGIERMAARLMELGHRRMVILREVFPTKVPGVMSSSALLRWDPRKLDVVHETFLYSDPAGAEATIDRHLSAPEPPTVFLSFGYELALAVRHILEERGLAIPQDISLVHWGAAPGPTIFETEAIPAVKLGSETVRILGTLLAGHVPPERIVRIPTQPLPGRTLGPVSVAVPARVSP